MLTTTGCLRLCNSGLLTRADVHCSVSRGQLLRYCTVPVLNGIFSGPFNWTKVALQPPPEYFSNRVPGRIVNREAKPSQIHGIESAKSATFMDLVCSYRIFTSAFPTNSGQAYWPAVSRRAICYTIFRVKIVSKWGICPVGHENGCCDCFLTQKQE